MASGILAKLLVMRKSTILTFPLWSDFLIYKRLIANIYSTQIIQARSNFAPCRSSKVFSGLGLISTKSVRLLSEKYPRHTFPR